MEGTPVADLAAHYHLTKTSIRRVMDQAAKASCVTQYHSTVIDRLVPKALAVFDAAMADIEAPVNPEVVRVATKVLDACGVLHGALPEAPSPAHASYDTLEEYRMIRMRRLIATEAAALASPQESRDDEDPGGSPRRLPAVHDEGDDAAEWPGPGEHAELPGDCADGRADAQ
jgi:hypothetical protein